MSTESVSTVSAERRTPKIVTPRRPAGTVYRGREGMWSWVLHRITGVAIYFFLLVHILDTSLVRLSPDTVSLTGNRANNTSGYYHADSRILGFSHTRLAGTGATDGGTFLVIPCAAETAKRHGRVLTMATKFRFVNDLTIARDAIAADPR